MILKKLLLVDVSCILYGCTYHSDNSVRGMMPENVSTAARCEALRGGSWSLHEDGLCHSFSNTLYQALGHSFRDAFIIIPGRVEFTAAKNS